MGFIPSGLRAKVESILATIVPSYIVTSDGGLGFSSFNVKLYEEAIIQLLNMEPSHLPPSEFDRCAQRAIIATIKAKAATCDAFEAELNKTIDDFKRTKPTLFRVASRCYFAVPEDYRLDLKLWGAAITITHERPKEIAAAQPTLSDGRRAFAEPEGGAYLSMKVYTRTKGGALERAVQDIGFLLGILNFTLNLGNLSWSLFSAKRPFRAKMFPGREVLLLNDAVADHEIWQYYTTHPSEIKQLSDKELDRLEQHKTVVGRLKELRKGDRDYYRSFFELYFEALTEQDRDALVMRLWKAAEHITMGQSAQHIANRLALTWPDEATVSAACYALGQRRNVVMHSPNPVPPLGELTELFRHILEEAAWASLSSDVKSVAHWKAIMQMSDSDIDLKLAGDAVAILKRLRR